MPGRHGFHSTSRQGRPSRWVTSYNKQVCSQARLSSIQYAQLGVVSQLTFHGWLDQPETPAFVRAVRLRLPGAEQPACCVPLLPAAPYPGSGYGTGAPSSQAALPGPPPLAQAAGQTLRLLLLILSSVSYGAGIWNTCMQVGIRS